MDGQRRGPTNRIEPESPAANAQMAWWKSVSAPHLRAEFDRLWIGVISRTARGLLMLSQVEVAEMTSLARSTIYYLENNKMLPDENTASALKKLFCEKGIVCDYVNGSLNISINVTTTLRVDVEKGRGAGLPKAFSRRVKKICEDAGE
jgi:DNA-binding XRE family transcriptional regulator